MRLHSELPIFRVDRGSGSGLYAPGLLITAGRAQIDSLVSALRRGSRESLDGSLVPVFEAILRRAQGALRRWSALIEARFHPECLSLYLSDRCNLSCGYCFSAAHRRSYGPSPQCNQVLGTVPMEAVERAARRTANHCRDAGRPFLLAVQGGGEPSLHQELLEAVVSLTRRLAKEGHVDWRGHISTNGVMSSRRARWIAQTFDHVGLSCDGPPDIQDIQRPLAEGRSSAAHVEASAEIFRRYAKGFGIRSTITALSVDQQPEIVDYCIQRLGCQEIRFEPVYLQTRGKLEAPPAARFIAGFFRASKRADRLGGSLRLSGVRMNEIHGPYCNLLRNVLLITPDGRRCNCFLGEGPWAKQICGETCDEPWLRRQALTIPLVCRDCVNILHCARDCPDVCYLRSKTDVGGYRCAILRSLSERRLSDLVEVNCSGAPKWIELTY